MEKKKDNLLDFLKNQITVENEIVASLEKALVGMKNPAVKGVLKGVSLDSVKHAELYSAAITLLTNASTALNQDNLDEQTALVKKHIEIEAKLIQKLQIFVYPPPGAPWNGTFSQSIFHQSASVIVSP